MTVGGTSAVDWRWWILSLLPGRLSQHGGKVSEMSTDGIIIGRRRITKKFKFLDKSFEILEAKQIFEGKSVH